jgi:hypothetical protein
LVRKTEMSLNQLNRNHHNIVEGQKKLFLECWTNRKSGGV